MNHYVPNCSTERPACSRLAEQPRSSGVGQQMFKWTLSEFRSRNCKIVRLTMDKSRLDAPRFYEKLSFVASHEGYKIVL